MALEWFTRLAAVNHTPCTGATGRALRPVPGKKLGHVIVPVLQEGDAGPDDIFESGLTPLRTTKNARSLTLRLEERKETAFVDKVEFQNGVMV